MDENNNNQAMAYLSRWKWTCSHSHSILDFRAKLVSYQFTATLPAMGCQYLIFKLVALKWTGWQNPHVNMTTVTWSNIIEYSSEYADNS